MLLLKYHITSLFIPSANAFSLHFNLSFFSSHKHNQIWVLFILFSYNIIFLFPLIVCFLCLRISPSHYHNSIYSFSFSKQFFLSSFCVLLFSYYLYLLFLFSSTSLASSAFYSLPFMIFFFVLLCVFSPSCLPVSLSSSCSSWPLKNLAYDNRQNPIKDPFPVMIALRVI